MVNSCQVLIVSDSSNTRRSLSVFLATAPDLDIICEVDAKGALEQVELTRPDVIVLDPNLQAPGGAGRLVAAIRTMNAATQVVVLASSRDDGRLARAAGRAAALGVVAATNDVADIVTAIRWVTQLALARAARREPNSVGNRYAPRAEIRVEPLQLRVYAPGTMSLNRLPTAACS